MLQSTILFAALLALVVGLNVTAVLRQGQAFNSTRCLMNEFSSFISTVRFNYVVWRKFLYNIIILSHPILVAWHLQLDQSDSLNSDKTRIQMRRVTNRHWPCCKVYIYLLSHVLNSLFFLKTIYYYSGLSNHKTRFQSCATTAARCAAPNARVQCSGAAQQANTRVWTSARSAQSSSSMKLFLRLFFFFVIFLLHLYRVL